MSAGQIRAGKAFVEIGTQDRYSRGLAAAQAKLRSFAGSVSSIGRQAFMAGTAIAAPLAVAAKTFASTGDQVDKMSQRTGIAAEELSTLGFAAEQSGSSLSAVEKAVRTMQRTLDGAANGSTAAAEALDRLGLSADTLRQLNPTDQLRATADGLSAITDPAERTSIAMAILGRSGYELLPMLSAGSAGMAEMQANAARLGLTISALDAKSAAELTDAFNEMRRAVQGLAVSVGAALAPSLTSLLSRFAEAVASASGWVRENQAAVTAAAGFAAGLIALGGSLGTVAVGAKAAAVGLGGVKAIMAAIAAVGGSAAVASLLPVLPILAGIAAALALVGVAAKRSGLLGAAWSRVSALFSELLTTAKATFGGIASALGSGEYARAAAILWAGVRIAFFQGAAAAASNVSAMFSNMLSGAIEFGKSLLSTLADVFASIPKLLLSALTGGQSLAEIISAALTGGLEGLTDKLESKVADAKAELAALTGGDAASGSGAASPTGTGRSTPRPGEPMDDETGTGAADAIRERIAALREEARVTRYGRDVAERMRLANDGATATQLQQLAAAQAARNAAEDQAAATAAAAKRSDELSAALQDVATQSRDELITLKHGEDTAHRYRLAQMGATAEQLRAVASIQKLTAAAREAAELRDAGQALREAVRNPIEIFRDEMARFKRLQAAGAVDPETLARASAKARDAMLAAAGNEDVAKEIKEQERRRLAALVAAGRINKDAAARALGAVGAMLDEAARRAGNVGDQLAQIGNAGTFSGFAAARMGGSTGDPLQQRIAAANERQLAELQGLRLDARRNRPAFG